MDLSKHLGAAIKRHRELLRLSQEDLADRAQMDRSYLGGIERGSRNPSVKNLQKIADALGSDLDVLFATAREVARGAAIEPGG